MAGIDLSSINSPKKSEKKEVSSLLALLNKDISFGGNKLSDKKKERFYSELAILLSAGVDIKSALEIIIDQQTKAKDKEFYSGIKNTVVAGSGLSEAMFKTNKFSLYEYYSLKIGEESGQLNEVLSELTKFYGNKIKQKRQIINSLTYPGIVFFTAFGAIFFMLKFIVPMFADIFKRFKADLPYLTKLIINLSDFLSHYFIYFFLIFSTIAIFLYMQREKDWFRKWNTYLLLKTPVVGEMVKKIYLARFCQSMTLLLSSKTPLVTSVELVRNMIRFYPMETSLEVVKEKIIKGVSLYESLSMFDFYDKRMLSLIKVAEEVNKLDVIFEKLSRQYEEEVQARTNMLGTLLEPFLIIFLGVMVAVILIAMYLPLFKLSSSIGM